MNTLEDAYINIAREEQRLLDQLEKKGVQRLSINPDIQADSNNSSLAQDEAIVNQQDLARFRNCKVKPSFVKQLLANYYRRFLLFISTTREIVYVFFPLCFIII